MVNALVADQCMDSYIAAGYEPTQVNGQLHRISYLSAGITIQATVLRSSDPPMKNRLMLEQA